MVRLSFFPPRKLCTVAMMTALFAPAAGAQDDVDDDILAPADDDEEDLNPVDKKKVGLVKLVAVGDANKALAERVSDSLLGEFEDAVFAVEPLALTAGKASGGVDEDQGKKERAAAKKQLKRAQKLLAALNFGRAEKSFKKAIEMFPAAAPALTKVDDYVAAHIGLAEVYARQGLEDETIASLTQAARLNPEHTLDASVYPPQFLRTFDDVVAAVVGGDKGDVLIDATARGATVFVDGRELGTAPLLVKGLPVGSHVVRVYQKDVGLFGEVVEVDFEQQSKVSPGFFKSTGAGPLDLLAQNRFDDAAAANVAEAAKEAGLDGAIVGAVNKTKTEIPTALIYVDAASKMVRHIDILHFDGDLLNLTIETLKAREEIVKVHGNQKFSRVDDEPLLPDVVSNQEVEIPETTIRYDTGKRLATKAKKRGGKKKRSIEGGGDEDGRRIASGGSRGKRSGLRSEKKPKLGNTTTEDEDEEGFLTTPVLIAGAGVGAAVVAVVAVGAVVGGGAAYYFLVPPTSAQVSVVLPE